MFYIWIDQIKTTGYYNRLRARFGSLLSPGSPDAMDRFENMLMLRREDRRINPDDYIPIGELITLYQRATKPASIEDALH